MTKEELLTIICGKEKIEVWKQFQDIENSIEDSDDLYQYFDDFISLLDSSKSYIRMRSFRIICKLGKWDQAKKIEENINKILKVLDDDKPTIVRMCLSSLNNLLLYKIDLNEEISRKLSSINISKYKESMAPLIKKDIEEILEHL